MTVTNEEIEERLVLGEDSDWEFKQIVFVGNKPKSPSRRDIAKELTAFANVSGGYLVCGITDRKELQGITAQQAELLRDHLVEISTDSVKPPLTIKVQHRKINENIVVLVVIPKGDYCHEVAGQAYVRVGAKIRELSSDERLKLAQNRSQSRYRGFDEDIVKNTGLETLDRRLWEPLLSEAGLRDPNAGLKNLRLLASDNAGEDRATAAGILLCTDSPHKWYPQARIIATHYRGADRTTGQLDAQNICGPLQVQIVEAVKFINRNMRVAARKTPARVDMPQYSTIAVFEAVVNAVAHRDYSMADAPIRISMFKRKLEIESPGSLPNGLTPENINTSISTRNEVIANLFGRISVGEVEGSSHRAYLMERRGDGVSLIMKETQETSGELPNFAVDSAHKVVLTIPAAKLSLSPSDSTVTVHCEGEPLSGIEVLVLFPNKTWQKLTTDEAGEATFSLYTSDLPMTVYAAARGYSTGLQHKWHPNRGGLLLGVQKLTDGGSVIFSERTGQIPGLNGTLNPIRDKHDRTYLYSNNIAIDEGKIQPVSFQLGKPLKLTDSFGNTFSMTIVEIIGSSTLVEYRALKD